MARRAMISQPTHNCSRDEAALVQYRAAQHLKQFGYEVVEQFDTDQFAADNTLAGVDGVVRIPLFYAGMTLCRLSTCDAVYFTKGWEESNTCKMEHEAAMINGLDIIYEEPPA